MQSTPCLPLLTGGAEQATLGITEVTFEDVVGARQAIQVGTGLAGHLCASGRGGSRGFQESGDVSQPGLSLPQFTVLVCERSQSGLDALAQTIQVGVVAMGEQLLDQRDDSLETLVDLNASQSEGWSALDRQQVAGVTKQLDDDGISLGDV